MNAARQLLSLGRKQKLHFSDFDRQQNLNFIREQTSVLGTYMMRSSNRVIVLSTIRIPQWLLSSALGFNVPSFVIILLFILAPCVFAIISANYNWDTLGLCLYYGLVVVLLYVFPRYAYLRLVSLSDELDQLFVTNSDRKDYIARVERHLSIFWQLCWGVLGVICSTTIIYFLRPYLTRLPAEGASLYIFVAILTWLEAGVVYWCWAVPQFVRQLYLLQELKLSALAPAYTPAILCMSRLLGTSSVLVTLSVLTIIIPVLVYVSYFGSREALITVSIVASAGMLVALFIGLAPQYWLAMAARRHKEQCLNAIVRKMGGYVAGIPAIVRNKNMTAHVSMLVALHKEVQQATVLAVKMEVVVKYLIGFVSALSPLLALLLKMYSSSS